MKPKQDKIYIFIDILSRGDRTEDDKNKLDNLKILVILNELALSVGGAGRHIVVVK